MVAHFRGGPLGGFPVQVVASDRFSSFFVWGCSFLWWVFAVVFAMRPSLQVLRVGTMVVRFAARMHVCNAQCQVWSRAVCFLW